MLARAPHARMPPGCFRNLLDVEGSLVTDGGACLLTPRLRLRPCGFVVLPHEPALQRRRFRARPTQRVVA